MLVKVEDAVLWIAFIGYQMGFLCKKLKLKKKRISIHELMEIIYLNYTEILGPILP